MLNQTSRWNNHTQEVLTLNSFDMRVLDSASQYLASITFAWAVTDCGNWSRTPAAWVRQ